MEMSGKGKKGGGVPSEMTDYYKRITDLLNSYGPSLNQEQSQISSFLPQFGQNLQAAISQTPVSFNMRAYQQAQAAGNKQLRTDTANSLANLKAQGLGGTGTAGAETGVLQNQNTENLMNVANQLQQAIPGQSLQRAQMAQMGSSPNLLGGLQSLFQGAGNSANAIGQVKTQQDASKNAMVGQLFGALAPFMTGGGGKGRSGNTLGNLGYGNISDYAGYGSMTPGSFG
jgi:hypothetical protein